MVLIIQMRLRLLAQLKRKRPSLQSAGDRIKLLCVQIEMLIHAIGYLFSWLHAKGSQFLPGEVEMTLGHSVVNIS